MKLRQLGYQLAAWGQGTPYQRQLKEARERAHWSQSRMEEWQLHKLNALLRHARATTNRYRNFPEQQLKELDGIRALPFLTKSELRHSAGDLTSKGLARRAIQKTTGGSTGAPVTVLKSRRGVAVELATAWRAMEWLGIHPGDKQARFWGVPHTRIGRRKAALTDIVANRVRCSAFAFSNEDLHAFHRRMLHHNPKYCYGYVSMLRQFSEYMTTVGLPPPASVECIVTTAEPLTSLDRKVIGGAFNVPVYNEYGCGELGTIAHECQRGSLHLNSDSLLVEILNEDGNPAAPGDPGNVVITDLNNFAMPLIRYALEDAVIAEPSNCGCGVLLPCIREVQGRSYDILVNKNDEKFHGEYFLYILEELKGRGVSVDDIQIIQKSIDEIEINVGVQDELSIDYIRAAFERRLRDSFSETVSIVVQGGVRIEREGSGKHRLIKRLS